MRRLKMAALFVLLISSLSEATAFAKELSDHPLIVPYPGSVANDKDVTEYGELELPTGQIDYAKGKAVLQKKLSVSGKVTGIEYKSPKDRSALEVLTNYKQGLKKGGFELLFFCLEAKCGRGRLKTNFLRRAVGGGYKKSGFLSAKLTRAEGDVYVMIFTDQGNGFTWFVVVESKPMEQGLVKVNADALLDEIDRTGHASIYGILFDTDKSIVKPESKQALGEIAKLLQARPALTLYVVGHTDNVGKLDYNRELSERRAAAVVAVLTQDYGVASGRLIAAGVGPLAPVVANGVDAGRARNRRVELVQQ